MAMQAQKLHFKCFLDEELLNWLQIARACVCMSALFNANKSTKGMGRKLKLFKYCSTL